MDEIEEICRLICQVENVNPDQRSVGIGHIIPEGQEYSLWETRKPVAIALLDAGYTKRVKS